MIDAMRREIKTSNFRCSWSYTHSVGTVFLQTSGAPLSPMLEKFSLNTVLTEDDRAAIMALPFSLRCYDPGKHIIKDRAISADFQALVSGFAIAYKTTSDGFRQIVGFLLPGDIINIQHMRLIDDDCSVQATMPCMVAVIDETLIRNLMSKRLTISNAIMASALIEASISREWIVNIGRRNARARIAHLFCELATRLDPCGLAQGQAFKLPLTQQQIGDAVGLTAVHVNRTIKGLIKDSILDQGQHLISFPNWDLLKKVAGFNDRYLHLDKRITALGHYQ